MELIQLLIKNLGVDEKQAQGGLGLLLKLAQEKLGAGDFSKLAELIPTATEMIKGAPSTSGGLMGAIGGLAASFGGKAADLGSLAGLAQGFQNLNLDKSMIQKFAAQAIAFVKAKGGDSLAKSVEGLLGSARSG